FSDSGEMALSALVTSGIRSRSHSIQLSATVTFFGGSQPYFSILLSPTSTVTKSISDDSSISASSNTTNGLPSNRPGPLHSVNQYAVLRTANSLDSAVLLAPSYGQALLYPHHLHSGFVGVAVQSSQLTCPGHFPG